MATGMDTCGPVTITYRDAATPPNCTGQPGIARTWTATDSCSNSASCVQQITFVDTNAPAITCPPDKQLQCGDSTAPANTGSATATDNCGGAATITFTDAPTPANCTGKAGIARTWKATDGCNNSSTCVQQITFVDTTAPSITCPPNAQLQCGASTAPANTGSATATDNCGGAVTITFTDAATPPNCTGKPGIARTWKATDGCNKASTCVQQISFVDTTAPVLSGCPANMTIGSTDPIPAPATVTATDNCNGSVQVTLTETVSGPVTTRTWTATDACGCQARQTPRNASTSISHHASAASASPRPSSRQSWHWVEPSEASAGAIALPHE
jgi:hypothetical protein